MDNTIRDRATLWRDFGGDGSDKNIAAPHFKEREEKKKN